MRIPALRAIAVLACAAAIAVPGAAFAASTTAASAADKSAAAQTATEKQSEKTEDAEKAEKTEDAEKAEDATEEVGPSEELLAWAEDRDCGACHTDQTASTQDDTCAAQLHTLLGLACIDCHADDALIDIHANAKTDAKLPTKLKKSELDYDKCATCHTAEALAEATEDCTALTDSEGTVVNPHELPDVKEHEDIACQSCHKMHSESKAASKAPSLCEDCHHEDVYECYTCHS